jgi:hypothetical protein
LFGVVHVAGLFTLPQPTTCQVFVVSRLLLVVALLLPCLLQVGLLTQLETCPTH